MALGDWCISIIPLRGLSEGMTNATRCVPTLIAGQGSEWSRCFGISLVRRDVACNVSVWIVSGCVGDVARYVSTGWMWVDVFSWKLLRFLKLRVIFALKTAKIGCTSAKHASKLDAFAFGLHYLCREQNKEEL